MVYLKDGPAVCTLDGLRLGVEMSRRFWKIQKECRTEPALSVVVPPVPHALVFFPNLLQLDLIARERLRGKQEPKPLSALGISATMVSIISGMPDTNGS
mgnify:CR=1 FL=1